MIVNKNFVGSRMNKTLDERLIPKGEYEDALNISISLDEEGSGFVAKNSLGNELMFTPKYNGSELTNAECIGALEDPAVETIYWFITSDEADMIVSFDMNTFTGIYHVVSTSVLNFSKDHLINAVNKLDDMLFFTDGYNPPRKINVKSHYPHPESDIDQITESDISVIVRPPLEAPTLTLQKKISKENYMEDKFIRFSYRYKYKDGEYSALSEFSDVAFRPKPFNFDYGSFDMVGMRNSINSVLIDLKTGGQDVTELDLCFKLSNSNVVNVIERFNKKEQGWLDDTVVSVEFDNQKIYTTLPESELLRVYDNVPKKAKAQTIIGNRLMYSNYYEGYDIDTSMDYSLSLKSEEIGFQRLADQKENGEDYTIEGVNQTIANSQSVIDLGPANLIKGAVLNIDFNIQHDSFTGDASFIDGGEVENSFIYSYSFTLPRDYNSVDDLVSDPVFLATIELTDPAGFLNETYRDHHSLSDLFFSNIILHAGTHWYIEGAGVTQDPEGFKVTSTGTSLAIQIPAMEYWDHQRYAYEYFNINTVTASIIEQSNTMSLHSNRDTEVGIVYLDEYNRASTVLVCDSNTVYVPPQNSVTKNSVQVSINHLAPSWAKRYRLVSKSSRGSYDTIYSSRYYFDSKESVWWIKLEGENQTKVKIGDELIVKVSSNGPAYDVIRTKVLDLAVKEKHFIDETAEIPSSSGVYMKLKPQGFSINEPSDDDYDGGMLNAMNGDGVQYPLEVETSPGSGLYTDRPISAGSRVRIYFENKRFGGGLDCGSRFFKFDRTFTANADYDNIHDFIISENINFNDPINSPGPESSDSITPSADFNPTIGTTVDQYYTPGEGITGIQYVETGTKGGSGYRSRLYFSQAGGKCDGRNYWLDVQIQIFSSLDLLVFETTPKDNVGEIFYESSKSYPIVNRYHTGNITNQSAVSNAVVDLDIFDCFAFGNGVESYKVNDSMAAVGMSIGARVTAVSESDYKEVHRYADITFSGVFNQETNIVKTNEFNLALSNFKTLNTPMFGPVEVIHARQSDILVLQEDKISYVLANGKNLFSDASAGGAIISTPDVLGQQIVRTEEYGISNNPESFSSYGKDVHFTDSKRGCVINLKGSVEGGDQLNVISSIGMREWFRDNISKDKMSLGAYDPYSNDYVLSLSDKIIPTDIKVLDCGFSLAQQSSSEPSVYRVNLGETTGPVQASYNVESGSVNISIFYNGVEVVNQTATGIGSVSFNRDFFDVKECLVIITPTNANYRFVFGCVQTEELTVIRIVKNTSKMSSQKIHHSYFWEKNGYKSPSTLDSVTFGTGPVSKYESFSGEESYGSIPSEGATVTMRYSKQVGDDAEWYFDKFKYLVSDTLYTEQEISTLSPLLQEASPISNPAQDVYEGSFVYSNPSNHRYLYLVWDYIEPEIECSDTLSVNGGPGIYEFEIDLGTKVGEVTLTLDSYNNPDRFQLEYDSNVVADSLFVGDSLPSTTLENEILNATSLNVYKFNGIVFEQHGSRAVSFLASDISDYNSSRPTTGDGSVGNQVGVVANYPPQGEGVAPLASDGTIKLRFNKATQYPTTMKVIVTGVNAATIWNLINIDCPTEVFQPEVQASRFYLQDWAWQDDIDPMGGSTESVAVIELENGNWYYDYVLPGSGISSFESKYPVGSTIDLSVSMDGPFSSLTEVEGDFIQSMQASAIVYKSNYVDVNKNNYTLTE